MCFVPLTPVGALSFVCTPFRVILLTPKQLEHCEGKGLAFAEVAEDPMLYPLGSLLLATLLVKFY